jgi:hypothetical protein
MKFLFGEVGNRKKMAIAHPDGAGNWQDPSTIIPNE